MGLDIPQARRLAELLMERKLFRFSPFSNKMSYLWHILEALNNYEERFVSQQTWNELGRPATTIADFARAASERG